MSKFAVGVDLGGTNLKGVIMSPDGACRHLTRIRTEANKGGKQVLANILTLIATLLEKEEASPEHLAGVGIGSPGFVDRSGVVLGGAENLPGWKGMQIFEPIRERFGLSAWASNDVSVTALAESRFGAGRGLENMVCFALGTGVGGGVVLGGKLYEGAYGMAGELGHIVVETGGIPCNCGQRGCVEQYASATAITSLAKQYAQESGATTPFVEFARASQDSISSKIVYEFAEQNDPVAVRVHETACEMLARACGIVCNAFAPDRIVLGGGVLQAGRIIVDEVARRTPNHCWPAIWERCTIARAQLCEDAGVIGAAALAFEHLGIACGPNMTHKL